MFKLLVSLLAFLSLLSFVSAWGAYVPDTWNSSQVYAGSYTVPISQHSAWTYNAYVPSNGYPLQGGARFYPPGYFSGGYAVSAYPSYARYPYFTTYSYGYGAPIHGTSDYYAGSYYNRCTGYYGC